MLAVSGRGLFVASVDFGELPNLLAAHFDEAPLFEDVDLAPERFAKGRNEAMDKAAPELWRALRRLASQGHDHERELQCFKGEITARRGTVDTWRSVGFWAGWSYQVLSDFGQSMGRPLALLLASTFLFAGFYLPAGRPASQESGIAITCVSDSRVVAAARLSVHRAMPFAGMGSSGEIDEIFACLYGLPAKAPEAGLAPQPVVRGCVWLAGVAQFLVSAVLIFLFVLAVRNRFRIR